MSMMIRTVTILICITLLFVAVIADETNNTTNSTSGTPNLTNVTNESQILSNTTFTADNLTNSSSLKSDTETSSLESDSQTTAQVTPAATEKPVYKLSVGSVYEADYQEPQPMTFTSYPTCS